MLSSCSTWTRTFSGGICRCNGWVPPVPPHDLWWHRHHVCHRAQTLSNGLLCMLSLLPFLEPLSKIPWRTIQIFTQLLRFSSSSLSITGRSARWLWDVMIPFLSALLLRHLRSLLRCFTFCKNNSMSTEINQPGQNQFCPVKKEDSCKYDFWSRELKAGGRRGSLCEQWMVSSAEVKCGGPKQNRTE